MPHYTRVEGGNANWKLYWLPVVIGAAEPQEGGRIAWAWIADRKIYLRYTNAPITVFMPEGTVVATGGRFAGWSGSIGITADSKIYPSIVVFVSEETVVATGVRFVKILFFFVDNTCQVLLADQIGSFDMISGFGKKHQICIQMQKYFMLSLSFFLLNLTSWHGTPLNWQSTFGRWLSIN